MHHHINDAGVSLSKWDRFQKDRVLNGQERTDKRGVESSFEILFIRTNNARIARLAASTGYR